MIIVRKRLKKFYIVSPNPDLEKHIPSPAVPNNFLSRGEFWDTKTPRVPIFKTIGDAISATYLGQKLRPGMKLFVYEAHGISKESLLGPLSIDKIPYFRFIKEWWYLKPINVKFIAEIEIGDLLKTDIYYYGPKQTKAYLYRYDWKELQKPWEKKFGPKLQKEKHYSDTNVSNEELDRYNNNVVSHRKVFRLRRKRIKDADSNNLSGNRVTQTSYSPNAQEEAVLRASKLLEYNKNKES